MVAHGDRHGIALHRVDRQADADPPRQDGALVAQRQDVGVGAEFALRRGDAGNPVPLGLDAVNIDPVAEFGAPPGGLGGEALGELVAVAGLVARAIDAAGDAVLRRGQGGLEGDQPVPVEDLDGLAVVGQDLHVADPALESLGAAVEEHDAPVDAVVGQVAVVQGLVQHLLGIEAEPVLAQGVDAGPLVGALAQEQERPGPEVRIGLRAKAQGLVLQDQGLQQDHRRGRRGPGEGVAGRDHAGVAPAGLEPRRLAALEDHHLVAVLGELVGGGHADHPGPHDNDLHVTRTLMSPGPPWHRPRCLGSS